MASLTDTRKVLLVVAETKNNGQPTLIVPALDTTSAKQASWLIGIGATDTTVDAKLQESADGSAWSDIAGASFTQVAATGDNRELVAEIAITATRKRYQRPLITVGAGATGAALAVWCVLGDYDPSALRWAMGDIEERKVVTS